MADIERHPDLEAELRAIGGAIAYPPTPVLAVAVRSRIEALGRPRSLPFRDGLRERLLGPRGGSRRTAMAALAVLLVALAAALSIPPVRQGLARLLHLPAVDIQRGPHPLPSPAASPSGPAGLGLGGRVTLAAARATAGFPVQVPQALGDPDQVYVLKGPYGTAVTLVYLPRPGVPEARGSGVGVLLTEVRGAVDRALLGKLAGSDTAVTEVMVGGDPGFWLSGAPHQVAIQLGQEVHSEDLRLAGDTLLWGDGARVWRIESGLTQQGAVRVATSLR